MSESENILNLNKQALQCISEVHAIDYLQEAFQNISKVEENQQAYLLSVTYNNVACYFRYQGKPHLSLQYLLQAQKIEKTTKSNNASTNLNLCAVYQDLKKYSHALKCAQKALNELQTLQTDDKVKFQIALAYLSIGTQYEFLKNKKQCFLAYNQGYQYAIINLGNDKQLTQQLQALSNLYSKYRNLSEERSNTQYQPETSITTLKEPNRKSISVYQKSPIKISPPKASDKLKGKKLFEVLEQKKSKRIKFPSLYQ